MDLKIDRLGLWIARTFHVHVKQYNIFTFMANAMLVLLFMGFALQYKSTINVDFNIYLSTFYCQCANQISIHSWDVSFIVYIV